MQTLVIFLLHSNYSHLRAWAVIKLCEVTVISEVQCVTI